MKTLTEKRGIAVTALDDDASIEDYLPRPEDLYVHAVARYAHTLAQDFSKSRASQEKMLADARTSFSEHLSKIVSGDRSGPETSSTAGQEPARGLAAWGQETCMKLSGVDKPPSKVGIAREYVALLEQLPDDGLTQDDLARTKELLALIDNLLGLPRLSEVATTVLVMS